MKNTDSRDHAYRIVRSQVSQADVMAHEKVATQDKPLSTRKDIAQAVAAALLALGAGQAMAAACPAADGSGQITVSTNDITGACSLQATQSLEVSGTGSISVSGTDGVGIAGALVGNNISNSGTIQTGNNFQAISLSNGSLSGKIYNDGLIQTNSNGGNDNEAIFLNNADIAQGITNAGKIISNWDDGVQLTNGSTLSGGLHNRSSSGTISGANGGGGPGVGIWVQSSYVNGGLTNEGTISGKSGIFLDSGSLDGGILNDNGGIIKATGSGNSYAGIRVKGGGLGSTITGGVINRGEISATAASGIQVFDNGTINGGLNNDGGTISGVNGVWVRTGGSITGGLTNRGTIQGMGASAAVRVEATGSLDRIVIAGSNAKFIGEVDAQSTPVTVAGGATYTMNDGQLFNVQSFTNSGTLIVGAGYTTTATITGDFHNTGTFSPGITNNTTFGTLHVNGNVTLGGTIAANGGTTVNGLTAGTLPGVITYTGTRTGCFSAVIGANTAFTWTVDCTIPGTVNLVLAAGSSGSGGSAGYLDAATRAGKMSALGAGDALDRIAARDPYNPVVLLFVNIPQANLGNAVSQTVPLLTGGSQVAGSAALTGMNRVIQARIESNRGLSSGENFYGDKKVWMKPFGSWADQDDRKGVSGFKARTGGIAFGFDGVVSDTTRLGVSLAHAKASINGNSTVAPHDSQVDVFQLIGYGSHTMDKDTELNFQVGIGQNKNDGRRHMPTFGVTARAQYTSLVSTAGIGIGRTFKYNETTSFTPSIRADYTWVKDKDYTETGAGVLNLNVASRKNNEMILMADGKLTHQLSSSSTVTANLGLGYDALAKQTTIMSAYAGAPTVSFTTKGLNPSPWMIRGGLGILHNTKSGMEVSARYDCEYRQNFLNQTASVKVRWAF